MNILNKLTLRSLRLNRKRTAVTIVGIALSGAMLCGVFTLSASFQDLFVRSAMETDGNYHATLLGVRYENLKYIAADPYTGTYMLSREAGFARHEALVSESRPYLLVKEYDNTAFTHMPVTLLEGRFPEREGEIVLSEEVKAKGLDPAVGQKITLEIGRRLDGDTVLGHEPYAETETFVPAAAATYTVTGFIAKPRFELFSSLPAYTAIAYLDPAGLGAAEPLNVSILGKNPRQIFERVPEMAERAGAADFTYNNELLKWMGITRNDRFNSMFYSIVSIVVLLIVTGSIAVIYNAFAISVSERKKQFGMLAGTGATPGQIRRTVLFEGIVLGLIGLPLGILAGIGGIAVTLVFVNRLAVGAMLADNVALRLVLSPAVIAGTVCFVGLVIFLSAFIPARRAAAVSPVEAIRLTTEIKVSGRQLKTGRLTRRLFGIEGELALKNLKRNRKRYRATVFSLFISIVLFISFSSFMTYGFQSSEMYYGDIPYDVAMERYDLPLAEQQEFFRQVISLDGVERYATIRVIPAMAEGLAHAQFGSYLRAHYLDEGLIAVNEDGKYSFSFSLAGLNKEVFDRYARELGLEAAAFKATERYRGILINRNRIAGAARVEYAPLALKPGDTVNLVDYQYGDEHVPVRFAVEIGAVTDQAPFGLPYAELGVNMVFPEAVFEAMKASLHEHSRENADRVRLYIKTADSAALVEKIRTLYQESSDDRTGEFSLFLQDVAAMRDTMQRTKTVVAIFLYGFVTLITLIGVTNIFNTISTNVALRRREFAMLKSVGLTPEGFNKMINYESIFYGLNALLYGLPAGIAVSVLLYNATGYMFKFAFRLPGKEILACVIGVLVLVFLTMLHASARLKKENIIDALRQENI